MKPLLERAIGVIYRPESELASHYFEAILPRQFDEYIWIDRTTAIKPLHVTELEGMPETYPFGLCSPRVRGSFSAVRLEWRFLTRL